MPSAPPRSHRWIFEGKERVQKPGSCIDNTSSKRKRRRARYERRESSSAVFGRRRRLLSLYDPTVKHLSPCAEQGLTQEHANRACVGGSWASPSIPRAR